MYIERLQTERGFWVQSCLEFPYLDRATTIEQPLQVLLAASGLVKDLQLTLRVSIRQSRLRRALIVSAPASEEKPLRAFIASLSRLELTVADSVRTPGTLQDFDEMVGQFPSQHLRAVALGFQNGAAWFAAPFRVGPRLDQLLTECRIAGHRVIYQVSIAPATGAMDCFRAASHNLIAMRSLPGVPQALLQRQQEITLRIPNCPYWVEEHLGTTSRQGLEFLRQRLGRYFRAATPELRTTPVFEEGDCADLTGAGLHCSTRRRPSHDEACAMAVDGAEMTDLLTWLPGPGLASQLTIDPESSAASVDVSHSARVHSATSLVPYTGNKPFVFISYSHADFGAILPSLNQLHMSGLRFWFDHGIPGSADWTQVLEERISQSVLLLVFLSQTAVDSKYVRREILMADALNKPILTVRLGDPQLRAGLKLILPQYQMVSAGPTQIAVIVRHALLTHYPDRSFE